MNRKLLNFTDGHTFAIGSAPYFDHLVGSSRTLRIAVSVQIGVHSIEAVVDTGGVYFICDPQVLAWSNIELGECLDTRKLLIRGYEVWGELHRLDITLEAEIGRNLMLNVVTFVPQLASYQEWDFPNFLGLQGCLEFIRFAVDPVDNTFYFGLLDD